MKNILLLALLLSTLTAPAQTVKLIEGSVNDLKGVKEIKVEFKYDGMVVGKDGLNEADYIKRKKSEYDAKEPGHGDKWEKAWYADREARYEPQFIELFTKHSLLSVKKTAKYTLIFKTIMTEPGWNVGVMKAPARINAEAYLIETGKPATILAKMTITNAPGRASYDFDAGLRIQEAYAKSGKEIGKLLAKQLH